MQYASTGTSVLLCSETRALIVLCFEISPPASTDSRSHRTSRPLHAKQQLCCCRSSPPGTQISNPTLIKGAQHPTDTCAAQVFASSTSTVFEPSPKAVTFLLEHCPGDFTEEQICDALKRYGNDCAAAMEWLLQGGQMNDPEVRNASSSVGWIPSLRLVMAWP